MDRKAEQLDPKIRVGQYHTHISHTRRSRSLIQKEWEGLKPDILMIPIGGRIAKNTMNEDEALEAVELISPKRVIPCHYNEAFFWKKNCNPADDRFFKKRVEDMGIECRIMGYGDEIVF